MPRIDVSFHGGGETTFGQSWQVVTRSVTLSREQASKWGLKLHTSLVTNGVLNDEKRKWLVTHLDSIGVSFDGPADIQNRQRPTASGW